MTEIVSGQVSNDGTGTPGNNLTVDSGGTAVGAVVSNGAYIYDYGTTSGTYVSFGGQEVISSGTASGSMVDQSAVENVSAGGTTISTTVLAGGIAFVKPGGVSIDTVVKLHGQQTVYQGGVASGSIVSSSGLLEVEGPAAGPFSAGLIVSATILSGGEVGLLQADSLATVVNGGTEYITPNAIAIHSTVSDGGQEFVYGGGITSAPTIGNSGTIQVSSGGSVVGPVTFAGGSATFIAHATPAPSQVFSGFAATDTIDLSAVIYNSANQVGPLVGNTLALIESGGGTVDLQMAPAAGPLGFELVQDAGTGTDIVGTVACFAEGTRILTTRGEVGIRHLRVGDEVVTRLGAPSQPVTWIGHRTIDCTRHPRPWDVMPVCVRANAVADGQPSRNLLLSPDHALLLDGVLIPVRYLLNGATIVQLPVPSLTYYHIELPHHNAVVAEGLAAESYLDTGNRQAFANGGSVTQLAPDFALQLWNTSGCAALVRSGAALAGIRARLCDRAAALGHVMTQDPQLRIVADGRRHVPQRTGPRYRLTLPQAGAVVRLVSRYMVPAYIRDGSEDYRRLGVALSRIWLDGQPIALDDQRLSAGWHQIEPDHHAPGWRWTDGSAALASDGARLLEFEVAMTGSYWRDPPQDAASRVGDTRQASAGAGHMLIGPGWEETRRSLQGLDRPAAP